MTGPYVEEQQHLFVLGRLWPQRLSKCCSEYFANVVQTKQGNDFINFAIVWEVGVVSVFCRIQGVKENI
jgi:hypothetical protein